MRMHFMMFSHGASWNIEFAPLFIFSPISHRCALCLPIDLITKVDFNWIAGKAHKVRTEVIKKKLGWTKRGRQRRRKRRIAGWKRSIAGNSQLSGSTFQTKAICPESKVWSASMISKQLNKESAGFSSPVHISYQPERTLPKWLPQQRRVCPAASWWELLVFTAAVCFYLLDLVDHSSSKTGNSAG